MTVAPVAGFLKLSGAALLALSWVAAASAQQPVEIRMGVGPAAEEQVWLMKARPDLTPNQGKVYTYTMTMFRGGNERITAYEAGQLDAATASTTGVLFASSKGIEMTVVANMAQESAAYFSTSYLALANSDVTLQNLKGKTIGLNGFRQSLELYARVAVQKAGLNPDRDVKWLVVPLPQMGEALRAKKIDLGVFPTLFAQREYALGDVKKLFDSAGISGIEEEFDVYFSPRFIARNPAVVKAWAQDFVAVTRYLIANQQAARQSLIDAKIVQIDPKVYTSMTQRDDLFRPADSRPSTETFAKLQEKLIEVGFQEKRVDVTKIVDARFVQ